MSRFFCPRCGRPAITAGGTCGGFECWEATRKQSGGHQPSLLDTQHFQTITGPSNTTHIAALLEEVSALRAALKPFADIPIPEKAKPHWPINYSPVGCSFADVMQARSVLGAMCAGRPPSTPGGKPA